MDALFDIPTSVYDYRRAIGDEDQAWMGDNSQLHSQIIGKGRRSEMWDDVNMEQACLYM